MEIRDWEELEKKLCKTTEEMIPRKSFDRADIDVIDKLVHSIDKIGKIKERKMTEYGMMDGSSSYGPRGGMWNAEGSYGHMMDDSYGDRMSYGRDSYRSGNMDSSRTGMERMPRVNY